MANPADYQRQSRAESVSVATERALLRSLSVLRQESQTRCRFLTRQMFVRVDGRRCFHLYAGHQAVVARIEHLVSDQRKRPDGHEEKGEQSSLVFSSKGMLAQDQSKGGTQNTYQ